MKKEKPSADLLSVPERADIVALVEVLLSRLAWPSKEGILWLDGDQLTFGAWHIEGGKRSSEVLEKVFQGSVNEIHWKWSSAMYEMHLRFAEKRYRVKFQGETAISSVAQDAAMSIDLPGLKLVALAEQAMDLHRVKGMWHAWEAALKSASGS
ncbi:MAG: hypothetical protein QOG97_1712 [Acidimicrobiaceae bacterium]|nr:hypothetical protein [Acidimicrobiaceae bacterium]